MTQPIGMEHRPGRKFPASGTGRALRNARPDPFRRNHALERRGNRWGRHSLLCGITSEGTAAHFGTQIAFGNDKKGVYSGLAVSQNGMGFVDFYETFHLIVAQGDIESAEGFFELIGLAGTDDR